MVRVLVIVVLAVAGCATGPKTLVERADNITEKPDWASTTNPKHEEGDKVFFLGYVELPGDSSKSAAMNMADEKAMAEPMRSLTEAFLDQSQLAEELRKDSSVSTRIISATRGYRPPMPTMKISKRYWEKNSTMNDTSLIDSELHVYSLVEVSKADFERAKRDYLNRLAGNSEVKAILKDVGEKQREAVGH